MDLLRLLLTCDCVGKSPSADASPCRPHATTSRGALLKLGKDRNGRYLHLTRALFGDMHAESDGV